MYSLAMAVLSKVVQRNYRRTWSVENFRKVDWKSFGLLASYGL